MLLSFFIAIENDSESKSKNVEGTTRRSRLEPGTQYDLETISSIWRYDNLSNLEISLFYYSDIQTSVSYINPYFWNSTFGKRESWRNKLITLSHWTFLIKETFSANMIPWFQVAPPPFSISSYHSCLPPIPCPKLSLPTTPHYRIIIFLLDEFTRILERYDALYNVFNL